MTLRPGSVVLLCPTSHLFRIGARRGDGARTELGSKLPAAVSLAEVDDAVLIAQGMGRR